MPLGRPMTDHRKNPVLCRLRSTRGRLAYTRPRLSEPFPAPHRDRVMNLQCEQAHCSNPAHPITEVERIACGLRGRSIMSKMEQTIEPLSGQVAPLVWSTQG